MIYRRDYESIENLNGGKKQTLSGKQIILILLPIFVVFMVSAIMIFLLAINRNIKKDTVITNLNETYTGDLIITATDIKVIANPDDEFNDGIIVGVRFEITNNCNEYYSSLYGIDSYVDDVMVGDYHSHLFNKGNEELYYSGIAKGKKVMGYVTAEAYKDSKKVEIVFEEPSFSGDGKIIRFIFDIPPVEDKKTE